MVSDIYDKFLWLLITTSINKSADNQQSRNEWLQWSHPQIGWDANSKWNKLYNIFKQLNINNKRHIRKIFEWEFRFSTENFSWTNAMRLVISSTMNLNHDPMKANSLVARNMFWIGTLESWRLVELSAHIQAVDTVCSENKYHTADVRTNKHSEHTTHEMSLNNIVNIKNM